MTALLEHAVASASGLRVLRATAWSRRWSWRSRRCISCAVRCLTVQEAQIARLAADRLSNAEVGARAGDGPAPVGGLSRPRRGSSDRTQAVQSFALDLAASLLTHA
jgi:hypothetical protein